MARRRADRILQPLGRGKPVRGWFGVGRLAAGATLAALVLHLANLHLTGNLHAIVPGEAYRSAQVDADDLAALQARIGVRSVLNLRGENTGTPWYDAEVAAAEALGITHADFGMSAAEDIDPTEARALIALMRDLPKPLLIHCKSGADRTGLASALYAAAIAGFGEETAELQLSPLYGHVVIPGVSRAWAMDTSWEALEPMLGIDGS